jgi:hypothetical protein
LGVSVYKTWKAGDIPDVDYFNRIESAIATTTTNNPINGTAASTDGNAYVYTTGQSRTEYEDRLCIVLIAAANSSGSITINVDGLGAKSAKSASGSDLVMYTNGIYMLWYSASLGLFICDVAGDYTNSINTLTTNDNLRQDIKGTIQYPTIVNGQATQILHKSGDTVIRTDVFTYATNLITEVRTIAATGAALTLKYHLDTLETEVN